MGRASEFNELVLQEYFSNLENINDKHQFTANRIFNVDETAFTAVQNSAKVVTPKKNVSAKTSTEQGEFVTAIYTIVLQDMLWHQCLFFFSVDD